MGAATCRNLPVVDQSELAARQQQHVARVRVGVEDAIEEDLTAQYAHEAAQLRAIGHRSVLEEASEAGGRCVRAAAGFDAGGARCSNSVIRGFEDSAARYSRHAGRYARNSRGLGGPYLAARPAAQPP